VSTIQILWRGGPAKLATSLGNDSDIVSSVPSVAGHAKWMKVGWARENER